MGANDKQVGGDHYKKPYQHWDFVCDTEMHYLLACATKYISRWREKNGLEDLEKPIHYLEKAIERKTQRKLSFENARLVSRFCNNLQVDDATVIMKICNNDYKGAIKYIEQMIEQQYGPSAGYVDQD